MAKGDVYYLINNETKNIVAKIVLTDDYMTGDCYVPYSWRKYNRNSIFHKILVLFGLQKSPSMDCYKYITDKYSIIKQNRDIYVIKEKEND